MNVNARRLLVGAVGWALLGAVAAAGEPLSKADLVERGKPATVLLDINPGGSRNAPRGGQGYTTYATAFCIHSTGLFLTTEQALRRGGEGAQVKVVLDSGLKSQKILKAKLVRADKDLDLALLRVEGTTKLSALSLGSGDNLSELMELVVFGYPWGNASPQTSGAYASVNVHMATISSLQRQGGDLHRIQLTPSVNVGSAGGPVLDNKGEVVGVITGHQGGGTANLAIPVNHVRRFLAKPDLQFVPPLLTVSNQYQPALFQVRAVTLTGAKGSLNLELHLRAGDQPDRKFPMDLVDGVYRAKIAPVPPPPGGVKLKLGVDYGADSLSGIVADRTITAGERQVKLAEVQLLQFQPKEKAVLRDAKTLEGPITGLEDLDVHLGEQTVRVKPARANQIRIEGAPNIESVTYVIVATEEGKEVGRLSDTLFIQGVPAISAEVTPGKVSSGSTFGQDKVVRTLPAPIEDLAVGGGGRFLILYLPKVRKLAVFDTNKGEVAKFLEVAEDNIKFAAGLDKLIMVLPTSKVIQRWDLHTFERETTAPMPIQGVIKTLAMGSAATDLVLVHGAAGTQALDRAMFHFLDVRTLKIIATNPLQTGHFSSYRDLIHIRASADGRVYGMWCTSHSPQGLMSIVVNGTAIKAHYEHTDVGHVIPSPDGKMLFTGRGLYTIEGKPLGPNPTPGTNLCVPAHQGKYYLSFTGADNQATSYAPRRSPEQATDRKGSVAIHLVGDARPLITLPDVGLAGAEPWIRHDFTPDKRIHFLPEAKMFVTIPATNDQLVVRRFDILDAMEKAGIDYLFVASQPPEVKTRKGGLKYKVESGPRGLAVSPTGKITWQVPSQAPETEATAIVSIRDAGGQECFHTFTLSLRE